eukprot:GHUV01049569.1.p1 GENE.GHUV01049569.1~~GHUV01049569.1.p1  ORF type:complete len:101 (-),score=14.38 GHUV01049569.1:168-470(-)
MASADKPVSLESSHFCAQVPGFASPARLLAEFIICIVSVLPLQDRSFTFILKTPPTAVLLKKAAGESSKTLPCAGYFSSWLQFTCISQSPADYANAISMC